MDTLSQILGHKIVAIIRGAAPHDAVKIATALFKGGIRILEVTMNSHNALQSIEQLSALMNDTMQIGAGTVLDADAAKAAIKAGARFIISPCVVPEVISVTKRYGAVSVPGAFTPTEIVNAHNSGGDIIKVFPSSSNAMYIREILAPLPHIPLMPTGGINKENMHEYFKAGASAVGIGTALVNTKNEVTDEYMERLTENARKFVQIKNSFFQEK